MRARAQQEVRDHRSASARGHGVDRQRAGAQQLAEPGRAGLHAPAAAAAAAASRRARAVHHREEVLDHAGRRRRCGRLGVCGRFLGFFI